MNAALKLAPLVLALAAAPAAPLAQEGEAAPPAGAEHAPAGEMPAFG